MTTSTHRTSLFAGVLVTNLAASVDWYSRLFGAEPSFRPDDTEAVWLIEERQFVYLKSGQGAPGGSLVTILVANLDGYLAAAAVRGVTPVDREEYGAGVSKAVFNDPDGNEFGVGTVPPDRCDGAACAPAQQAPKQPSECTDRNNKGLIKSLIRPHCRVDRI